MKLFGRRSFFATAIGLLFPAIAKADDLRVSHPGGALDQWLHGTTAKLVKAMNWACVCMRHGAHWTIGAIGFAAASIGQVRHHLVSVHGHSYSELNGLSKEQLGNLHDAHHEGRTYKKYNIPRTPSNGVDHLAGRNRRAYSYQSSGCPGGVCPR